MYFHHWTFNECSKEFETVYLKNNSMPDPSACVKDNSMVDEWVSPWAYCSRTSLAWAVGGDRIQDFPDDLAYPLGGSEDEFKYFYLEIHYNNPDKTASKISRRIFFFFLEQC